MMMGLGIFYLLVSVVLFAVAIVVHFNSSSLSLPISPIISILAAILPIIGFLNAFIFPSLLYATHHLPSSTSSSPSPSLRLRQLSPLILQTLQALITTILATLLMEATVPSDAVTCILEHTWAARYSAHDGHAIRQIQDHLSCCGLNSVRDRAFPFQRDGGASTCPETFGRDDACRDPWRRAMQTNAGVDLMVVLMTGLLQIFGLVMMREGKNWWTAWRGFGWHRSGGPGGSSRPLLTGGSEVEEQDPEAGSESERQGYGGTDQEERPRVEPSPIHERNAWEEH